MIASKYLFDRVMSGLYVNIFICFLFHMLLLYIDPENGVSCVSIKKPESLFDGQRIFLYNFFKVGFDRVE